MSNNLPALRFTYSDALRHRSECWCGWISDAEESRRALRPSMRAHAALHGTRVDGSQIPGAERRIFATYLPNDLSRS